MTESFMYFQMSDDEEGDNDYIYNIINTTIVIIILWFLIKNYMNENKEIEYIPCETDGFRTHIPSQSSHSANYGQYPTLTTNLNSSLNNYKTKLHRKDHFTNVLPVNDYNSEGYMTDSNTFESMTDSNTFESMTDSINRVSFLTDNFNPNTIDDSAALLQSTLSNIVPYRNTELKGGMYGDVPVYFYNKFDNKNISKWHKIDSGNYLNDTGSDWKVINYAKEMPQWEAKEGYVYNP